MDWLLSSIVLNTLSVIFQINCSPPIQSQIVLSSLITDSSPFVAIQVLRDSILLMVSFKTVILFFWGMPFKSLMIACLMQLIMLSKDSSTRPCLLDELFISSRGSYSSIISLGKLRTIRTNSVALVSLSAMCLMRSSRDCSSSTTLNLSQNFIRSSLQGSTPPIRSKIDSLLISPLNLRVLSIIVTGCFFCSYSQMGAQISSSLSFYF